LKALHSEKGQALLEFLLIVPVLALLAYGMALLADLALARLAVVRVTREVAVFATRQESGRRADELKMMARAAADRMGLKPWNINAVESPVNYPILGGQGAETLLAMAGLPSRITVEYRYQPGGPLKRWFKNGMLLRESVVLQSNPWREPGEQLIRKVLEGVL